MSKKDFKEKRKARRKEFGRGQKGKERAAAAKAKEIADRKMDELIPYQSFMNIFMGWVFHINVIIEAGALRSVCC